MKSAESRLKLIQQAVELQALDEGLWSFPARKPQDLACLLPYIVGKPKDTLTHELPEPTIIHLGGDSKLVLGTKKAETEGSKDG